ncbi:hypothetical protein SB778_08210 [Paraburkholderia sp. SIMBA_050]
MQKLPGKASFFSEPCGSASAPGSKPTIDESRVNPAAPRAIRKPHYAVSRIQRIDSHIYPLDSGAPGRPLRSACAKGHRTRLDAPRAANPALKSASRIS